MDAQNVDLTYILQRKNKTLILTPKAIGCLRLVYHRGGVWISPPPPKISALMAPMDIKFCMLVVFGLYF